MEGKCKNNHSFMTDCKHYLYCEKEEYNDSIEFCLLMKIPIESKKVKNCNKYEKK